MNFFKSNKNTTTSAAATPAQTPRTSMQEQRPAQTQKMTPEQALEFLRTKTVVGDAAIGPYIY